MFGLDKFLRFRFSLCWFPVMLRRALALEASHLLRTVRDAFGCLCHLVFESGNNPESFVARLLCFLQLCFLPRSLLFELVVSCLLRFEPFLNWLSSEQSCLNLVDPFLGFHQFLLVVFEGCSRVVGGVLKEGFMCLCLCQSCLIFVVFCALVFALVVVACALLQLALELPDLLVLLLRLLLHLFDPLGFVAGHGWTSSSLISFPFALAFACLGVAPDSSHLACSAS